MSAEAEAAAGEPVNFSWYQVSVDGLRNPLSLHQVNQQLAAIDAVIARLPPVPDTFTNPRKTDPYDPRTPDGSPPTFIPLSLWLEADKALHDMRWYAVCRPIPAGPYP